MRHSFLNLLRQGLSGHRGWPQAWRNPEPRRSYEAVIVGGGGHGLATAYYLAGEHGLTDVAVLERGWIGGGNTVRNTTNVRSDYMYPESAALYDLSLRVYEGLGRELDFNIMLSQRGWLFLIHDLHQMETARHKANWMQCNGIDGVIVDSAEARRMLPALNPAADARYPVIGAFPQRRGGTIRHDAVAWGYARAADRLGVDIIQNCAVEGLVMNGGCVTAVQISRGTIGCGRMGVAAAAWTARVTAMAGFPLPMTSHILQAMVTEPVRRCLDHVVISPATGAYVNQTRKGELVIGGIMDLYQSFSQRGTYPSIEKVVAAVVEMFPAFSSLKLMRHWAGVVDITPDRSPIIGPSPVPNLHLNCGWGTGGFKAIPAGGLLLAHAVATGRQHALAEAFGLERFRLNALVDEAAASGIAH